MITEECEICERYAPYKLTVKAGNGEVRHAIFCGLHFVMFRDEMEKIKNNCCGKRDRMDA